VQVVDASVVVAALVDSGPVGQRARERLSDGECHAPALLDIEVVNVLRTLVRSGRLDEVNARRAVRTLPEIPIERSIATALVTRLWELRHNVTPYDAAYVALAERLAAVLVTGDRRLAAAPGARWTCWRSEATGDDAH